MGGLSLVAVPKLWRRSQEAWTETQGTLVDSYLKEGKRTSSAWSRSQATTRYSTYDVRLRYRYQVQGKDYDGDAKAMRQPKDDEKWEEAKAVQESYKTGETLAVFYDPDNPVRSRFTAKEAAIEFKKDILLAAVYLLGGWGLCALGRRVRRKG
jgi:hypothetical protein